MRSTTAFGISIALLGLSVLAVNNALKKAEAEREQAITAAIDTMWSLALKLGAEERDRPSVRFVDRGAGWRYQPVAETVCQAPRPRIEVNTGFAREYQWFTLAVMPPHEMAHVLECVKGEWDANHQHGVVWESFVRALVDKDRAELVIGEQESQRARSGDDGLTDVDR